MNNARKYVLVIPDGAADEPCASLGGLTPLAAARLPEMDAVSRGGVLGMSSNVPELFLPGSDVATLSLFGYDPEVYFTGRAPLEAAAMGIPLGAGDWAVRCNLTTIADGRMADFTAGHVTSDEGRVLIEALAGALRTEGFAIEFHAGVSYRNIMIVRGGSGASPFGEDTSTTPPHDIPDQLVEGHLPRGRGSEMLRGLMRVGSELLSAHPINAARVAAGKRPANAVWLWGQGSAPRLPKFEDMRGLKGGIIAAVDLVRGVGVLAGWDRIDVAGATGYLDTDYAAKGRAAVAALDRYDIVCVHVEAPDEASHEGRADAKVTALERIDAEIVGPLRRALEARGNARILISPDHATLLRTRAHDRAPVPWAMAGAGLEASGLAYDEASARAGGGPILKEGRRLMDLFLKA